jgi:hypothetical protein
MKLNARGYQHAQRLVEHKKIVLDQRDDWSEHQPSTKEQNSYIQEHGIDAYARWFLGLDETQDRNNKGRYKFPYGDFEKVHRCGVLAAESRAGQRKYYDIESAAAHLHGMLEALMRVKREDSLRDR